MYEVLGKLIENQRNIVFFILNSTTMKYKFTPKEDVDQHNISCVFFFTDGWNRVICRVYSLHHQIFFVDA